MNKRTLVILSGVVGVAVLAFLAFGVFGIQTLFTDDQVNEANPFAAGAGASGLPSDTLDSATADDMNEAMPDEPVTIVEDVPMPEAPEVVEVATGAFIDRIHPGTGTAIVLNDGSATRFLRFESDFEVDNGPDLNVYLVAGVDADGDAGLFDDDFIDLGDLKGNIGSQNYELTTEVDLETYDTIVIWCVRFGVAFAAADLS